MNACAYNYTFVGIYFILYIHNVDNYNHGTGHALQNGLTTKPPMEFKSTEPQISPSHDASDESITNMTSFVATSADPLTYRSDFAPKMFPINVTNMDVNNVTLTQKKSFPTNNFILPQRKPEGAFCRRSFDGRSGYCIVAYQCLHVIREHRMHGNKIDICTYRKNIPVICCPLADKHVDDQRISAQKCQEFHETVKGIKLGSTREFSGKMCVSSRPLIVGGEITRNDEFPHMAALGWTQSGNEFRWGCGGTLISDMFVLTAAHCVTSGRKAPDVVRLGAQNLNKTTPGQQNIKILIIILHPKYSSSSHYNDIALLKLAKRVQFTIHIQPACLWQLSDLKMSKVVATGWGRTEFSGRKSDELRKVELNIIDQRICKEIYRKERRLPHGINEKQFCAGYLEGGRDSCHGDSGGPLHAELPEFNCVKFIIGITSFGKFCAAPNAPGVYTKIYSYLDWIEKIAFK